MRFLRALYRGLGSTKLAVVLFLALLAASILGSLFPQMPATPESTATWLSAVRLRYGAWTGLFHSLRLFDVYRSAWYLFLLAALVMNTVVCTIQRLPRMWRSVRREPRVARSEAFYSGFAQYHEWRVVSMDAGVNAVLGALRAPGRWYRTHVERDGEARCAHIFAERGRWGRLASPLSHIAAILLVFAAAARPVLGWHQSGLVLLPGQHRAIEGRPGCAVEAGELVIDRHEDGQPRHYRVPLSVASADAPLSSQIVRINHPLVVQGLNFHLQGYGPAARIEAPEGAFYVALSGDPSRDLYLPRAGLRLRLGHQPQASGLFVEASDSEGAVLGSGLVRDGERLEIAGTLVSFSLSHYTTWQVTSDPTFSLALASGALYLAATMVSLWLPRRLLWLRIQGSSAQMVGAQDGGSFAGFDGLAREIESACLMGPGETTEPAETSPDGSSDD